MCGVDCLRYMLGARVDFVAHLGGALCGWLLWQHLSGGGMLPSAQAAAWCHASRAHHGW